MKNSIKAFILFLLAIIPLNGDQLIVAYGSKQIISLSVDLENFNRSKVIGNLVAEIVAANPTGNYNLRYERKLGSGLRLAHYRIEVFSNFDKIILYQTGEDYSEGTKIAEFSSLKQFQDQFPEWIETQKFQYKNK